MKDTLSFPLKAFFPFLCAGVLIFSGCDSGEKVVDEVTGNRAVKQYHQSKKRIEKIAEQQAQRYEGIGSEEEDKNKE
ncbi:MAG: hypothetical protein JRH06_10600 [Deltaproteobacteria bacterium]|nr:hypothetical protein [Deltaproteobacteria bacterium]MBW2137994.1 hypothetical protein [Deltaproteobacteria bacterium]